MAYGQTDCWKAYSMFGRALSESKNNMIIKKYESENGICPKRHKANFDNKNKAKIE